MIYASDFFSLPNTKDAIISEILCNLNLGDFIALPKEDCESFSQVILDYVGPTEEIKSAQRSCIQMKMLGGFP